MGLRTLLRTSTTLVATTVVAALLTAPSATARPCADCEEPEIPGPGGPNCPTIAATTDPYIQSPTSASPAKVGATVTARTGIWNGNTKSMKATWYVGNSPATSAGEWDNYVANRTVTFDIRPQDIGKPIRLWVRGIGSNTQCYKSEYSDDTAVVSRGDAPLANTQPSVAGALTVGTTLTVNPGTWSLPIDSFGYIWRWADGTHRGTGASYQLTGADLDKEIRLDVTAHREGHHEGSASITTARVTAGDALVPGAAPTVTGKPVFGETLTVSDTTWTPAATTVQHQWLRNGTPIDGAHAAAYRPVAKDVGSELSVRVTASRAGHPDGTVTTEVGTVKPAAKPVWKGKKVTLKGKDKVGKKIKVALGKKKLRKRASAPDAKLSFQWLRNGKAIKKQTKMAHRLVKADRGKKLKVRITLTRPGHQPLNITTKVVKIKDNGRKIK